MIDFIEEVGSFVGNLLGMILNIPMGRGEHPITFGIVLTIIVLICFCTKFYFGGRGD